MTMRSLLLNSITVPSLLLASASGFAQDPPVEYGKIPKEDLAMSVCPLDSSADAMILADYGQSCVNDEMGVDADQILRIKLFRKSAFDRWGTRIIGLYTRNAYAHLQKLEGATYALGTDGNIVQTELPDEGIFKEKKDQTDDVRHRYTIV